MLNYVWAFLVISALLVGGLMGRLSGDAGVVTAIVKSAESAVMNVALPMAGLMIFWLGALRVMEQAGLLERVVRFISPLMRRLFPDVPKDHPALSHVVMNWTANMLGLGNMATPFGLKAMASLQELNPHKNQASDSMAIFLALNTGAFTLIPMTVINYLNAGGLKNPYQIILPTICSSACATVAAVVAAKFFQRLGWFRVRAEVGAEPSGAQESGPSAQASPFTRRLLTAVLLLFAFITALEVGPASWRTNTLETLGLTEQVARLKAADEAAKPAAKSATPSAVEAVVPPLRKFMNGLSVVAIPALLLLTLSAGLKRGVKVYEEFVEGAKEGFAVVTRIMPFLVTMLVALAMFRASGMLALLQSALRPVLSLISFPVELLPLALMRPLSGSGSVAMLNDILYNPASTDLIKYTAGILFGSTETTFYVIAVYFGSVGIRHVRHALAAGLTADAVGMTAAILFGRLVFG